MTTSGPQPLTRQRSPWTEFDHIPDFDGIPARVNELTRTTFHLHEHPERNT